MSPSVAMRLAVGHRRVVRGRAALRRGGVLGVGVRGLAHVDALDADVGVLLLGVLHALVPQRDELLAVPALDQSMGYQFHSYSSSDEMHLVGVDALHQQLRR